MVNLVDIRTSIVTALTGAGIKALDYAEQNIVPPAAIVIPAEPYLSTGERFGEHNVSLQILVIGPKGTNKVAAEKVDNLIQNVIVALDEWDITEVSAPQTVTLSSGAYLGAVVSVQTEIQF